MPTYTSLPSNKPSCLCNLQGVPEIWPLFCDLLGSSPKRVPLDKWLFCSEVLECPDTLRQSSRRMPWKHEQAQLNLVARSSSSVYCRLCEWHLPPAAPVLVSNKDFLCSWRDVRVDPFADPVDSVADPVDRVLNKDQYASFLDWAHVRAHIFVHSQNVTLEF